MSRVDELIAELCPGGVPFSELSELASTVPGLTGKTKSDFSDGNARFASYRNIFANPSLNLDAEDFVKVGPDEKQNALRLGDILITGSSESLDEVGLSSVVTTEPPSPIYLNSFCFILRLRSPDMLEPGFAKHLFRSESIRKQIRATASGVTRINISKPRFMKVRIPVPPLEVQREIVRILDQFTQLEAELEAELEARRRQYEHYQRALLAVGSSVENVPMGEIAAIGTGRTDRKDATVDGAFPLYVRSKDVLASDRWEFDETAIIIPGEGGIGEIFHFAAGKYALHQRAYRVAPHDTRILPRFLYFYLRENFGDYVRQRAVTATVTSLRRSMLTDFPVPLLPLEEQTRVVETLDQLDALINDIRVGLPAELAARRKQYEYYRDKLLTFTEAA